MLQLSSPQRLLAVLAALAVMLGAAGAEAGPREIAAAVVGVRAEVPPEARTADTLGRVRTGSGVVIDSSGLVLTIGYLILEAAAVDLHDAAGRRIPAEIVAYDHDSGFGLVRASEPLNAAPLPLGSSGEVSIGAPLLVLSREGELGGRQTTLSSRREFAGYWEYLLPDALFTSPPHPDYAGAALIDAQGRLVGIGSLMVGDATAKDVESPGNMFVPVDALKPILGDLLALGRRDGPGHPWIGVTAEERGAHVLVHAVTEQGPAEGAGLRPGDVVLGVGSTDVGSLAELYRAIWRLGDPGVPVPLRILRHTGAVEITVPSVDRLRWLRLNQTY